MQLILRSAEFPGTVYLFTNYVLETFEYLFIMACHIDSMRFLLIVYAHNTINICKPVYTSHPSFLAPVNLVRIVLQFPPHLTAGCTGVYRESFEHTTTTCVAAAL